MKAGKNTFVITVLVIVVIFASSGYVLGYLGQPFLSKTLTDLFGMPVTIEGLYVHPLPGFVKARRITFHSLPRFGSKPHLDVLGGIRFSIDFLALLNKRVRIGKIVLERPVYIINRIKAGDTTETDVVTWYDHIDGDDTPSSPAAADADSPVTSKSPWTMRIKKIEIRTGSFIISDRSTPPEEKKYVFSGLYGVLDGLHWPVEQPEIFKEKVRMRGKMGEYSPAPFYIKGHANFATSQVSFDLRGRMHDGDLRDYAFLWEGLPVQITGGKFLLRSHVRCIRRELESRNYVTLKSMQVKPGGKATDKIWGIPLQGWMAFLQNEKKVNLKIEVSGNVTDPRFTFWQAFRVAFQDALRYRMELGLGLVTTSAKKIVTGAGTLAVKTPITMVGKLGQYIQPGTWGKQKSDE